VNRRAYEGVLPARWMGFAAAGEPGNGDWRAGAVISR